jgi:uncharacterized lipoprotein YmbA
MRPRASRLTLVILGVWLAATLGCAGSPPTRFYVLTPTASAEKDAKPAVGELVAVGLRRVTLPEYLDRPQIVTRVSPTKVDVAEFDRWAAPLGDAFAGALAENLAIMIPTDSVAVFPWPRGTRIDYEVAVDVTRFEGRLGGSCDLVARWSLLDRRSKEALITGRSTFTDPAGDTYEAMAAAHSRLVTALGRDIAGALRQAAGAGSRAQGR